MLAAFQIRRSYSSGQVIVLAAGLMVVLVGMLGLAIDLGYSFAQKRSVQNAADAGAIAGANAVTRWSATNTGVSALADVVDIVNRNRMGNTNTVTTTCDYINDADTAVGSCGGTVPATATGVRVTVTESHDTFFIQAVPGAPSSVTTKAVASAHVDKVTFGADSPFIICGVSTKVQSGGTSSIMSKVGGTWTLNSSAIGKNFLIHGPQIADCGMPSNSFKGLADQGANENKTLPDWFESDTGVKAGPTRTKVNGIQGCQAGQDANNCILIVPVGVDDPKPPKGKIWVVAYLPFMVRQCGANCHEGTLLANYTLPPADGKGPWTPSGWKRGDGGVTAVRLTK